MCSTQPQRAGPAIACPVIEPPSHGATAPGGAMTGPALYVYFSPLINRKISYTAICLGG